MTRKHFVKLAEHLILVKEVLPSAVLNEIVEFCYSQNENFSEAKFRSYINNAGKESKNLYAK